MNTELRLYFFDPRPAEVQTQRVQAIHEVLNNKNYWEITDRGEQSVAPHFNLTVQIREPFIHDVPGTPALSFITKRLQESGVPSDMRRATRTIITEFLPFQQNGHVLDLAITLPHGEVVHSSSGEAPSITFNYDSVVRHDATAAEVTTLETLQTLEYQADLRIKFASIDSKGRYVGDASKEYESFFADLPAQWAVEEKQFEIQTRSAGNRRARALSHEQKTVAAVEHETGLEILVAIGLGIAGNAVYELIRWGITKWINRRKVFAAKGANKAPTFLEIERVRRNAAGQVLCSEVLKIPSPVQESVLQTAIERFLGDSSPSM